MRWQIIRVMLYIGLLASTLKLEIYAQESVSTYNQFVLPTDVLSSGETCTGPNSAQANIFVTAKNNGWLYSGFMYSAFLTSLNQYSAAHGSASSAYSWDSEVPINTSDLFTLSACDYSYCILQKIFGQMPGLFFANGSPKCAETNNIGPEVISNLLRLMNIGIFTVVSLMVAYGLIGKGVLVGGFEGDILQKNFTFSTASRIAVAMFSIIPMPGIGYSAMQNFMMYVVLLGVGFADSTFRVGLDAYLNYGAVFSFAGLKSSDASQSSEIDFTTNNVQNLINTSASPDGAKYASVMSRMSCAYYTVIQDRVSNYENYNTSVANDALINVFPNAQTVSFNDVISIDTTSSQTEAIIKFGNYSASTPPDNPQCGTVTWKVPSGQTPNDFIASPAYQMLQTLYQSSGKIFENVNRFNLNGFKTQSEQDYYTCLQGTNIMYSGLVMYTDVGGRQLYRPFGRICTYDPSTTDRTYNLQEFVNDISPYTSNNQIDWVDGCSGDCLSQYSKQFISDVAAAISENGIDVTKQMTSQQLQMFSFGNGSGATDPTNWVINTGNTQFNQNYIGDLLVLVQDYRFLAWSLQEQSSLDNLYAKLIAPPASMPSSSNAPDLTATMNTASLNLMTQSILAPFFGSKSVDFVNFQGKILWKNLAISASNFTTSLVMIMQRLIGFHYYDKGTVMTLSWYASEGKNSHPSVSSTCKSTYQSNCSGSAVDNCYNAMNNAGCFMNDDGVGRGLLGTTAMMYNVGSDNQQSDIVIYDPLADYIEIGYTVLTAASYYLFQNNMEVIALYIELAATSFAWNTLADVGKAWALMQSKPDLPPWCPRFCKNVIITYIETAKMVVDFFVQLDQDRIGFYNSLGTTFMVLFIPFGAVLTILLPLYPTIIFIVGIFGWLASVVEALIAGPMVAVGLCHPEGSDFLGKAEMGFGILLQTFLRPVLIVLGVFLSIAAINLSFYAFNVAYATQYAYLAGGSNSPLGGAMNLFNNWEVNIAIILSLVMIYAYVSWQLVSFCCVNMIGFSNQVLMWVSSGSARDSRFSSSGADILAAAKSQVSSDAGSVGQGLGSVSGKTPEIGAIAKGFGEQISRIPGLASKEQRGFSKDEAGNWKADASKLSGSIYKMGKSVYDIGYTPAKLLHLTGVTVGTIREKYLGNTRFGLEKGTMEKYYTRTGKASAQERQAFRNMMKEHTIGGSYKIRGTTLFGFHAVKPSFAAETKAWANNILNRK